MMLTDDVLVAPSFADSAGPGVTGMGWADDVELEVEEPAVAVAVAFDGSVADANADDDDDAGGVDPAAVVASLAK